MVQGSLRNRHAVTAMIVSAAAVLGLSYLLSPRTDEELSGPPGPDAAAIVDPRGPAGPGAERHPAGDGKAGSTGSVPGRPDAATVELAGPPLLRGVVSGEGAPIDGASVHLISLSHVERLLTRISTDPGGESAADIPDFESIVQVLTDGVEAARRAAHIAKTDASGEYAFRGIEPREYLVLTIADGWIFRYGDVVVLAAGDTRDLNQELERGASISGRVVDGQGRGVGGIAVAARARTAGESAMGQVFARLVEYVDGTVLRGPFVVTTSGDGAFDLASLQPGAYDLEARGSSGVRAGAKNVATGRPDALILLGEPAWVEGVVVDSGGAPLAGITVEVGPHEGEPIHPMMMLGFGPMIDAVNRGLGRGPSRVATDVLGRFRSGPVGAGDYRLAIVDRAVRPLERRFTLSWGQQLSLDAVRVDRGARLLGRVLSEGGEGIDGAAVTISPADAGLPRMGAVIQAAISGRNRIVSGPGGEFEAGGLAPGQYWVSASAPGWTPNGLKAETGEDDCEIRLARGARVTGIVTDALSRDPVRAKVRGGQVEAETDAAGRFVLDGVVSIDPNDPNVNPLARVRPSPVAVSDEPERRVVTLEVSAEGYAGAEVRLDLASGENQADVRLLAAPEISGRVVSPAGDPVAGSLVRVITGEKTVPPVIDPSLLTLRTALTDREGRYRIRRFQGAGRGGWYRLVADHPVYARGESRDFRLEAEERHEIDLTLMSPATVRGVVTDGARPVAGAEVRLAKIDKAEAHAQREIMMRMFGLPRGGAPAYTDGDGRFDYRRVVAGDYVINVNVPGLGSASEQELRVEAGREIDLELLVDAGAEIRGMVFDTDGNTLEGALVKLIRDAGADGGAEARELRAATRLWGVAFRTTRTDEDGVFVFTGVPDARYTVHAVATGYASAEAADTAAGDADVELVLSAGAGFAGHVRDAATGEAVTDFSLVVVPEGERSGAWVLQNEIGRGDGREENRPEGRFSRSDLAAGMYRISVKAAGYLPVTMRVELHAGRLLEQDVELARGARIRGVVVDRATRRPVAGASVGLEDGPLRSSPGAADPDGAPEDETGRRTGDARRDDDVESRATDLWRSERVRTDARGRFLIDGVPAGVVTALVNHNEYVPETKELTVGTGEALELEISLERGLMLAGRAVTRDGEAVGSRFLLLSAASSETRGVSRSAVTSPDGTFRFAGLKPGRYRVSVPPADGAAEGAPESIEIDLRESTTDYLLRSPGR